MGENGSGKSTIIDTIRSLSNPGVLASLSRENPPTQSWPSFSIELIENGAANNTPSQWSYLFHSPDDQELNFIGCSQVIQSSGIITSITRLILDKDSPKTPVDFVTSSSVHYTSNIERPIIADEGFIAALNKISHFLPGLNFEKIGVTSNLVNKSIFTQSETGLAVWLHDDSHMQNLIRHEWLPSGWQSFASIIRWASEFKDAVLLIEEPETHLHPKLMYPLMKLLYKLAKDNNLQLFIATHSASLLNAAAHEEAQIFQSKTTWIDSKPNVGVLLDEMGYRASDILQSNCIIWVEGPSDRTYINFWIRGLRNDFVEGTHYTIMFYGGRLLSHLGALDASGTDDFIELTSLNRHNAIIMDSDKKTAQSKVNATKKRIQTAFSNPNSLAWITDGREIENYLDADKLKKAIKKIHSNAIDFTPAGQWSSMLKFKGYSKKLKMVNGAPQRLKYISPLKVKISREYITTNTPNYSVLGLKQRMDSLISFIVSCN